MPNDINIAADFSGIGAQSGRTDWRASGQWATRPDDQRYTSLDDMLAMMRQRRAESETINLPLEEVRPMLTSAGDLGFEVDGQVLAPTNYAFQQICSATRTPAEFMGRLSGDPELVVRNMRAGFRSAKDGEKEVQILRRGNDMRAVTSPSYGRIWDDSIVEAVQEAIGASGTKWEVPTAFRVPGAARYETVEVTKADTTLYAGDRDQFGFLVDQNHPIEAGRLASGEPDLYYRGFYWWNGECGGTTNGISTFLYRYVCANRSIREQKGFQSVSIIHRANAPALMVSKLIPALKDFVNGSTVGIVDSMAAARRIKVCSNDEDRMRFFAKSLELGPDNARAALQLCIDEEGHPVETMYDTVQALSAFARGLNFQAERTKVERQVGKLLANVA